MEADPKLQPRRSAGFGQSSRPSPHADLRAAARELISHDELEQDTILGIGVLSVKNMDSMEVKKHVETVK